MHSENKHAARCDVDDIYDYRHPHRLPGGSESDKPARQHSGEQNRRCAPDNYMYVMCGFDAAVSVRINDIVVKGCQRFLKRNDYDSGR